MKTITDKTTTPFFALSLLGIAMGIIPLNDALIKLMSGEVPLGQIIAIRAVVTLGLLGIFSRSLRSMFALPVRVFWLFFACYRA